jgi:hypothetical protein
MSRVGFLLRMAASVAIDVFDLTGGRLPIAGTAVDGLSSVILFFLWGPAGLTYLWEIADITDQIDGFVPTATIIGLYVGWRQGILFERGPR